jgi:hypothetical protein
LIQGKKIAIPHYYLVLRHCKQIKLRRSKNFKSLIGFILIKIIAKLIPDLYQVIGAIMFSRLKQHQLNS